MLDHKSQWLTFARKISCTGLMSLVIGGCSSPPEEPKKVEPPVEVVELSMQEEIYSFHTHQKVDDYTDRLAYNLIRNLRSKKIDQPIVVTSFVHFDDTLKNSSKLGNLVSESLIGNMQKHDVPVIDIHLMGGIDITPTGDHVFSRNSDDILYAGEITYVLSGVLVENERGFTINARIMELETKKIISTASTFIPTFVIDVI